MYDPELYDALSKLRRQLAKETNLPVYTVFSNQSLIHMCEMRPKTKQAFLTIHGVGQAKCEKYGQLFLDTIAQYCENKEEVIEVKKESFPIELTSLIEQILNFYHKRDWEQFHSPKNLVMDLASEMGELVELFRWLKEEESYHLDYQTFEEVRDEIADVFKTLIYLSHKLGIDPLQASRDKLVKMEEKYPVEASRGKSLKYTHYLKKKP
jgi:dCTP diphosphatase